jgi:hypothetical protein
MTEAEWLACIDPDLMLQCLSGKENQRQLRLFAIACAQPRWRFLTNPAGQPAVEMAESVAEGRGTLAELSAAHQAARDALANDPSIRAATRREEMVKGARREALRFAIGVSCPDALDAARQCGLFLLGKLRCALLRDVCNPFFRVAIEPVWLTANDSAACRIAQEIYDERAFDQLPILADALEEAGCTAVAILYHLRSPGPHVRGRWALDLVMGRS